MHRLHNFELKGCLICMKTASSGNLYLIEILLEHIVLYLDSIIFADLLLCKAQNVLLVMPQSFNQNPSILNSDSIQQPTLQNRKFLASKNFLFNKKIILKQNIAAKW